MAITRNKMVPVLGIVALVIVAVILIFKFKGHNGHVKADAPMTQVPGSTLSAAKGADRDNPTETLKTLVAGQDQLRTQVQQVLADNKVLKEENDRLRKQSTPPATPVNAASVNSSGNTSSSPGTGQNNAIGGTFGQAINSASNVFDAVGGQPAQSGRNTPQGAAGTRMQPAAAGAAAGLGGNGGQSEGQESDAYRVVAPMGYSEVTTGGHGKPETVSYVRAAPVQVQAAASESAAARIAASAAKKPVPYFTVPENATLVGATAMTALIGRVPIDNRVTDPMQFKAVVGRDNLAANGFDLPGDIAGMIVSGIAIGDMTLSCSEGKIRSATFIFNDGTVRTVSTGVVTGAMQADQTNSNNDLGYISDMYGNPCIQGKYVSNAPAYLTDITAMKTLTALGQAYAAAQTQVMQAATTGTTSAVTGNMGAYALGQAISAGADEVSKWMLDRLKSSFDAVVTPAGQQLVIHLNKELDIDKDPNGRRLVQHNQEPLIQAGERYGLE